MSIVDIFGNIVSGNLEKRPVLTREFVKLGYSAQQLMLHVNPNAAQLPSQQYAAQICMKHIRKPMCNPKSAALVNLFLPCELLHAMDISPMCAEGISAFLAGGKIEGVCLQRAEDMGVPDTYCSFHKTLLGAIHSGMLHPPRLVLATNTVCDANYSTFNAIAGYCDIPKYFIDVPSEDNKDAVEYVASQLEKMVRFMEEVLGRKMSGERLAGAVANTNRAVAAHERFLTELETRQMPTTATLEMYRLLTSHILMGTEEAATFYEMLASDASRCERGSKKRILWCHVLPFALEAMQPWFDEDGPYQLLPTDLHYDAVMRLDPQRPLYSMAKRLISNHLNGKVDRRIDAVLSMAKRLHADGAVVFCHWGCKASNGSAFLLRDALQREGIPTIALDGDACDRRNMSEGQFSTRLQAFFEVLEGVS